MAFEAGVALPEHARYVSGMGTDFRDIDNDGHPDVVLVARNEETFPLYRNTGKGSFVDITTSSGLAHASRTISATCAAGNSNRWSRRPDSSPSRPGGTAARRSATSTTTAASTSWCPP